MLRDDIRSVIEQVPKGVFVAGRWRDAVTGQTFPVEDPATTRPLCQVANGTAEDAVAALDAAVAAQPEWARTPRRERGEILRRGWELMVERRDELALLMTLEMGKSLAESRGEVTYAAEFFR